MDDSKNLCQKIFRLQWWCQNVKTVQWVSYLLPLLWSWAGGLRKKHIHIYQKQTMDLLGSKVKIQRLAPFAILILFKSSMQYSIHLKSFWYIIGFVASRARRHLENLTSFGPRPTGSPENEIMALNTIIDTLGGIQRNNREHNNQDLR